ncbi:E3 ubiquitin-protein ligase RNF146 [Frankliniella fusca]|uniref:E3 ubiquitin-protein ligase n=1 Tax=Frankliniella fusca TaxID=407009 RepID=A0AAE1HR54_9NEOP|nr:E3 ubiquitin-protein ligase RNF146 [Frankliniella fusca]
MAESLRMSKDNNEKHRRRQRNRERGEMCETKSVEEGVESVPECAVCLQTCVHPAKLPCSHVFCFLCLKGLATQSRRCAMCRQDIPLDYLDHPQLLEVPTQTEKEAFEDGYQWFYEGRSGWWQYDERTSRELELAFKNGQRTCELLIVGQLYIADFDAMLQLRRNDMSRRRRIKRDLASIPKKGIAGLRLENGATPLPDNVDLLTAPSTSQSQLRREPPLTQSVETYDEQRHVPNDLRSGSYRNVVEFGDPEQVSHCDNERQEDSSEEEENQEHDQHIPANDSDPDETEIASQLNDLWLH